MKEAEVCTRIVNTFLVHGHEAFKIPDMPRTAGTKFNRVKGYDISASIRREAVLIEAKLHKAASLPRKLSSFKNLFTPHQIKRFDRVTKNRNAHCFAFVVLYRYSFKPSERIHSLYIVPWQDVLHGDYAPDKYEALPCIRKLYSLQAFFDSFPRF